MANVDFSVFLPEISHLIQGCPEPTAINAVRNATIEFCSSNWWQETQDSVDVDDTDFPLTIEGTTGATVVSLLGVNLDGRDLVPTTMDELDKRAHDWRENTSSLPTNYYQPNPEEVCLYPRLDTTLPMILRVSYAPLRSATSVVEYLYQIHLETIAAGALARLMAIPMQPWSNPKLAMYYSNQFNRGKNSAAMDANKSFSRAPLTVQMRRFA